MTELPTPSETTDEPRGDVRSDALSEAVADPLVLASGICVALGLVLLLVGVLGSWHWKAAIWGSVLCSLAAFALVAVSARRRRTEFPGEDQGDELAAAKPAKPAKQAKAATAAAVAREAEGEPPPPKPRFSGLGKKPTQAPPDVKPPPPRPSNVQVMPPPGGANVRIAPTPKPMPIARPDRTGSRPPSTPPSTPPTIQVGVPREPGFPVYQPVDPEAPVIQVRNRYHRPDCRYVTVADDAQLTTVGAAKASHAMPCGVCRP